MDGFGIEVEGFLMYRMWQMKVKLNVMYLGLEELGGWGCHS